MQEAHLAPYLFSWDNVMCGASTEVDQQTSRKRKAPETLLDYAEYIFNDTIYPPPYKRQKLSSEESDDRVSTHSTLSSLVSSPECAESYVGESDQSCSAPSSPSSECKSSDDSNLELPKGRSPATMSSTLPSEKLWRTLREKMRYNHIHQKEVAKDIGVSPSTISSYMNRKSRLNGWHCLELAIVRWLEKNESRFNLNIIDYTKSFKLTPD
jgi:predicted XRE-type DNA-binding protein